MTAVYDQNTGQWTQRPAHQGPLTGGLMRSGSVHLRTPGRNETVAGNMERLQSSGSPLMQLAGRQGEAFAARRGLGNSTLAAQASQQAALQAALPIAQADAQLASQAASQNAEVLNAAAIADMQRQAASAQAGTTVIQGMDVMSDVEFERQQQLMRLASELNISEAEAGRLFEREMTLGERDWRSGESALDREHTRGLNREEWEQRRAEADAQRGWQSTQAERDRDFERENRVWLGQQTERRDRMSAFTGAMGQIMQTVFSSPDFFRDPTAAQGFMDFFGTQFSGLFDRFFGTSPGGG